MTHQTKRKRSRPTKPRTIDPGPVRMSRHSDQPQLVEAMAFTLFLKSTAVPSAVYELDEWMGIWRTVDVVAKEQYREQAQQQMREFEGP